MNTTLARLMVTLILAIGLWVVTPNSALARMNAEVGLPAEIAAREPRPCILPPQLGFQDRSLWNANLWPGGVVPYEFDANTTAGEQAAMRQSMDALEAAAYVHFVARTGQVDYLHVQDSDTNYNYTRGIGDYGGRQDVNIYNWNFRYIMCHELMHALGVQHEHSRPDRDLYITVNYGNIQPGWGAAYDIQPGTPVGPFDFDSVMLYGACDASTCCPAGLTCSCASGCWTMTALPAYAQYQSLMGQRSHLSAGDIAGLVSRYGAATCPVFGQQPANVAATTGQTVTFTVTATGAGIPTYRWRRNSMNLSDGGRITGSATSALSIHSVSQADIGSYDCVATNSCGSTSSNAATLTVGCAVWAQASTTGPSPSPRYARAAFDSVRGMAVLFGGFDGAYEGDTWEWNRTSWLPKTIVGPAPSGRAYHATAFDSRRGVTVLFSGLGLQALTGMGDTWEWNGVAWAQQPQVNGPSARYHAAMVYDSARGVMVLYGGVDGTTSVTLSDTWEWNGTAWTQQQASGQLPSPGPRAYHAMAYDSARGVTVLFGGATSRVVNQLMGDTWEWNGSAWAQRSTSGPTARFAHAMAFDNSRNTTVLFGGGASATSDAALQDTWEWNGTTWTPRAAGTPTGGRYLHAMWFDSGTNTTTVFGGVNITGRQSDTWTLGPDPVIQSQPAPASGCALGIAQFSVMAVGAGTLNYRWQWQPEGTQQWIDVVEGVNTLANVVQFTAQGAAASNLTVSSLRHAGVHYVNIQRAIVSNECGSVTSSAASLSVCPADYNCSGAVSVQDIFDFLAGYFAGNPNADFNGSGVISVQDIFDFLAAYFAGC